jgi:uncharacterized zinc-type alcohol dehydrogenase-like protein
MYPVKSYAAPSATQPLAPFEFSRRDLRPHDVLIDIRFCGICHSDIHQVRSEWGPALYPMVPGHEIVGVVAEVGKQVKGFKPGDKAGVGCMIDFCRECAECKEGYEQYCGHPVFTYNGYEKDGKTLAQEAYARVIKGDVKFRFVIDMASLQ